MAEPRGSSIRLWQTELFIVVIVVAILILSGSISAGLKETLTHMAETNELRNASSLAQRLSPEFPVTLNGTKGIRQTIADFQDIYGGGIWVYNTEGQLLEAAFDGSPLAAELEAARLRGLDSNSYVSSDFRAAGWVVAAKPVYGDDERLSGVVVTASSTGSAVAILQAVRSRMWVAFWISLIVASLLGFTFSEFIGRRIRAMSNAAASMAAGDFEQRLPTRYVPNELRDLAQSYNVMAVQLGDAFGELQESQREIAAVVESMAEGVLAFDSFGCVRVMNPEARALLGLTEEPSAGSSLEDLTDDIAVLDVMRAGLSGQSTVQTLPLGHLMVRLQCTPLIDATGEVQGGVLLLADVTEAHRVEAAQRRFVADASHEMRTPIAALRGMLELLIDGAKDSPAVRDDFLNTMQLEVERLGRLVADLLMLAQLEAGSLRLRIEPTHATDLLEDVARVMKTLAEQISVTLSVESAEETRVLADRDRVVQVLLSFTDNALKHSGEGSTVHLRATPLGDTVRLEVTDEGSGIEAEELSQVFERFYRADSSRSGRSGAGLGLAIAKEIVEAHDSTIEVSSQPGVGTTFSFELPCA